MARTQKNTFAQTLNNACDLPLSNMTSPCIKGNLICVQIDEGVYLIGFKDAKSHLHGIIILSKGGKPLIHMGMCKKLDFAWKYLGY